MPPGLVGRYAAQLALDERDERERLSREARWRQRLEAARYVVSTLPIDLEAHRGQDPRARPERAG